MAVKIKASIQRVRIVDRVNDSITVELRPQHHSSTAFQISAGDAVDREKFVVFADADELVKFGKACVKMGKAHGS